MKKIIFALTLVTGLLSWSSCSKDDPSINIFSIEDDIALGQQVNMEIAKNPQEFPILDPQKYATAYEHLIRIRNNILASGKVKYANTFQWNVKIIQRDDVVNAFCLPGGDMYFYTGLIKFLDNEAQLAGVMAHEMAHADRRHSTDMLTRTYGFQVLAGLILGNNANVAEQIATELALGLGSLAFSRSNEYEADEYAVKFLYPTEYDAASLGDFFKKMEGAPHPPAFLSTHPSPEDRLQKINEHFQALGGVHGKTFPERYSELKSSLP